MTSNFSHLKNLQIQDGHTVEYTFWEIAGEPFLNVRPAGEANKNFFNALLKKNKQSARRSRKAKSVTTETLADARREDIDLFVQYIISGWGRVENMDGELVPFSRESCAEFLNAIPGDMFDSLRIFCLNMDNFREDESMEEEEREELMEKS